MAKTETSGGMSQEEKDAVKARAKELREQAKAGKNREAGEKAVAAVVDELPEEDKALAEGLRKVVSEVAPDLVPKTYYGMPGYANADGKMVVFIQPASKFKTRYSTLGFEAPANLDDGDMWATAFALLAWTPVTEKKVTELVKAAIA